MTLTCINCPMGCSIEVTKQGEELIVSGNTCARGATYAKQEFTAPKRMLTSLVKLSNGLVAPVKTDIPIEKNRLFDVLEVLRQITLNPPVHIGDVVIADCLGLGADIIITKNID